MVWGVVSERVVVERGQELVAIFCSMGKGDCWNSIFSNLSWGMGRKSRSPEAQDHQIRTGSVL